MVCTRISGRFRQETQYVVSAASNAPHFTPPPGGAVRGGRDRREAGAGRGKGRMRAGARGGCGPGAKGGGMGWMET